MTDHINGGRVLAFARKSDPTTSWEAACETAPRLRDLQRKVLQFAFERGPQGFTDDQLNDFFASKGSTYRTRRSELTAIGYIGDTGARVGEKGRRHIVWAITPVGRRVHCFGTDSPPPMAA